MILVNSVSACLALHKRSESPFCHLLQNDKLLLDYLDPLGAADHFLLPDDHLGEAGPIKIVNSVEVVKVVQGSETTPVVEGV